MAWISAVDPGISSVLQQRVAYWDGRGAQGEVAEVCHHGLRWTFVIYFVILVVGGAVLIFTPSFLSSSIIGAMPANWVQAAYLSLVSVASSVFGYSLSSICSGLLKTKGSGFWNQLSMWASFIVLWYFLVQGWGVLAPAYAAAIRALGFVAGHWSLTWSTFRTKPAKTASSIEIAHDIKANIKYTFIPRLVAVIAYNMDAVLITKFLGPADAAVFGSVRKLPEFLRQITEKPLSSIAMVFTRLHASGRAEVLQRVTSFAISWTFITAAAAFVLAVYMNHPFAVLWLKIDARLVTREMILGAALIGFASTLAHATSIVTFALGDIKGSSMVGMVQALAVMAVAPFSAKYGGVMGFSLCVAVALMISAGFFAASTWRVVRRPSAAQAVASLLSSLGVGLVILAVMTGGVARPFAYQALIYAAAALLILVLATCRTASDGLRLWQNREFS